MTGSPRLAVNPPNAMLNYLYAVLESESRLAASALGLDPGIGVLHVDTPARDSLACDLMEVVRPQVDAFLLDWITREPLKREWFLEQRDGNCRLMAELAVMLSETAPVWGRAVAPFAEWVAGKVWSRSCKPTGSVSLPTRLTQRHKREAKGKSWGPSPIHAPRRENLCRGCGNMIQIGEARAKHVSSQRRHALACSAWDASTQPTLTSELFAQKIQPLLAGVSAAAIRSRIGVSRWYAGRIRQGYRPHPRHWQTLAQLVGVLENV